MINNKFLIVKPDVRLTPTIIPVIKALDVFFEKAGLKAYVTSGERTSQDQLDIIRMYSKRFGVDKEFPEIRNCGVLSMITMGTGKVFTWQRAWSRLLNIGVIINPPLPAKALFDYFRDGVNKKGTQIGYSPHYYGHAFDIGGGLDHDITNELHVVEVAFASKMIKGFKGFLPERKNNCVHVDCIP